MQVRGQNINITIVSRTDESGNLTEKAKRVPRALMLMLDADVTHRGFSVILGNLNSINQECVSCG